MTLRGWILFQIASIQFNWIDIVVVIFVIRGIYLGYRRGLTGELLRFLGIVLAIFLAFKFYQPGSERLIEQFSLGERAAIACSFTGIFLAVIIFFYLINRMVQRMMELSFIAAVERGGGALLGGMKTLLFACAVLIVLALVKVEAISHAVSQDSFFGSLAISAVPGAYRLAVRVYPGVESLPAEEVIEKLPEVTHRVERGTPEGQEGDSPDEEDNYVKPDHAM